MNMKRWAMGAMIALALVGCKKSNGSRHTSVASGGQDADLPLIVTEFPLNAATGVAVGTLVMVTFDDPMNATSINTGSYTLREFGGSLVAGTVSYDPTTRTATFSPSALLMPSTSYVVSLSAGITNTMGESLGVSVVWSFKTAP